MQEVVASQTASRHKINNLVPPDLLDAVQSTARQLDNVRDSLRRPILVSSWYRCLELNRLLRSSDTSQHVKGQAVDFVSPGFGSPAVICKSLVAAASQLNFDQLILEHTWVHISFIPANIPNVKPRNQVLSLLSNGKYAIDLTNKSGEKL